MKRKKDSIIRVYLTLDDIMNIKEWYRAAHHIRSCNKPVIGCHITRKKIQKASDNFHKGDKN